jgi:hypothetical protein
MGIDPIGKKSQLLPPTPNTTEARPSEAPGQAFGVERAIHARTVAGADSASESLQQLRTGAIDLDTYLDSKVSEATAHLGPLAASQIDAIRSALRDRLATDPTLVDLVQRTTAAVPRADED